MTRIQLLTTLILLLLGVNTGKAQQYEEKVATKCDYKVVKQNGKYGVWEKTNLIIKITYDEIIIGPIPECWQNDGHFFVRKKKKWGIANKKGEIVLPFEYDSLKVQNDYPKMIFLYKSGKMGLYYPKEKKLIEPEYERMNISQKVDNRMYVRKKEKWGMMDLSGNITIEPVYEALYEPGNHPLFCARKNSLHGFIDIKGNVVIPFEYESSNLFSTDKLVSVKKNGKWGFLDTLGNTAIEFKFDKVSEMSDEWAEATLNGENGRIDLKGNFIRNPDYDYDKTYKESYGYRIVVKNKKSGYINKFNQLVVPCIYDDAYQCVSGVGPVVNGGKIGLVSMKNEVLVPIIYKKVYSFYPGTLIFENQEEKMALFNRKGEQLTEWLDEINPYESGYGTCKKGSNTGKLAPSGMIVWDQNKKKEYWEVKYFNSNSARIVHKQNENDYVVNLDIHNDGNKVLLLTARTKKGANTYALEITQLNAKSFASEKKSSAIHLPLDKKTGLRKFEKTSDGYLIVTYRVAAWFDKNLNLLHKKEFGLNEESYSHDFCSDVIEIGKGSKKYIILTVLKNGQGVVSGFDLASKKESLKPYYLHNPFLLISNISGKIHEVNDQNVLIIHKGSTNREKPYAHYSYYEEDYFTTLINYEGLLNDKGVPEKHIGVRNTGYNFFTKNIADFYTLEAVWMGMDGYLHFMAGIEDSPYTSYEVAVGIEPDNINYQKIYRKDLYADLKRTKNPAGKQTQVTALHIRQLSNGYHITSGTQASHDGMIELFDQGMNYLGTYSLPDEIINRNESKAFQDQYSFASWKSDKYFSEMSYVSFKYQSLYTHIVNEKNINYSLAFCEGNQPGKYLVMYQHMVVETDLNNVKQVGYATDGAPDIDSYSQSVSNSSSDYSSSSSSSSGSSTGGTSKKTDTKSTSSSSEKPKEHSGSIYFKFSYSDKNYTKEPGQRMYIHYGSNAAYKVSTTVGSSATVKCQPGKVYVSYTGEKKDMVEVMDIKPEDCGKTFDSSRF